MFEGECKNATKKKIKSWRRANFVLTQGISFVKKPCVKCSSSFFQYNTLAASKNKRHPQIKTLVIQDDRRLLILLMHSPCTW